MYYVPWWLLAAGLLAAAFAVYLALRGRDISRVAHAALTVLLAPVLLAAAAFVAVVASTGLSIVAEPPVESPTQPLRTETTTREPAPEATNPATTPEEETPEPTSPEAPPEASPEASPGASPSASPGASSASASASASASPAAGE